MYCFVQAMLRFSIHIFFEKSLCPCVCFFCHQVIGSGETPTSKQITLKCNFIYFQMTSERSYPEISG